ncbi:MAG: hypothetical protein RL490_1113 [Pseudomonadota bacterium]|jgi:hypothetical protein
MAAITLVITTAGRAALVNAANAGTNAVRIAAAGLTATNFAAAPAAVALPGEFVRIPGISGATVDPDTISLVIRDDSAAAYTLRGLGLFLADGTLFALYGQAAPILEKAANATALIVVDVRFVDIDATTITFGDANFLNPPATTSVAGVIEIATTAEATAGEDAVRALTPAGLKAALDGRFGANSATAFVRTLLTAASAAAFRLTLGIKAAALKDEGHGNSLDADTVDGYHVSRVNAGGVWPCLPVVHTSGVMEVGTALDFHTVSSDSGDYVGRLAGTTSNLFWNNAPVWHAANDGSGSGLDADLLDGVEANEFVRGGTPGRWSLASTTINAAADFATLVIRETNFAGAQSGSRAQAPRLAFIWSGINAGQLAYTGAGFELLNGDGAGRTGLSLAWLASDGAVTIAGNPAWHAGNDGSGSALDADLLDGQDGSWYANIPARLGYTPYNATNPAGYIAGITGAMVTGALGYTPWHAGNDGAGSGLDADLLDGRDSASFANASHQHSAADLAPAFAAQQLQNNGWQELPGGLLMQWGRYRQYIAGETSVALAFERAFAAPPFICAPYGVNPTGASNRDMFPQLQEATAGGAIFRIQLPDSGSARPLDGFDWFAFGLAGSGGGSVPGSSGGGGGGGAGGGGGGALV